MDIHEYDDWGTELNFTSLEDFTDCMTRGGEVEFIWKGKHYCMFAELDQYPDAKIQKMLAEAYVDGSEQWVDTVDELLDCKVGEDKLRDVFMQIKVIDRTI